MDGLELCDEKYIVSTLYHQLVQSFEDTEPWFALYLPLPQLRVVRGSVSYGDSTVVFASYMMMPR